MEEKKSNSEDESVKFDLESIAGLTWIGVLALSGITKAGYEAYSLFPHAHNIANQAYQVASDIGQYFPFVNS